MTTTNQSAVLAAIEAGAFSVPTIATATCLTHEAVEDAVMALIITGAISCDDVEAPE
jgi:hypothetical protein